MRTDWNGKPYYSLDYYLKETFGTKVYKLALDGGMTCPNRDGTIGTGGCIFCSEGGSGDFAAKRDISVRAQVEAAKNRVARKMKPLARAGAEHAQNSASENTQSNDGPYIAYFQSYTNTYAPLPYLEALFTEAISLPEICALSIGTRPDCLPYETIELLARLNKEKPVWIELGLQTIHEKTAEFIRRGYKLSVFEDTFHRLKVAGLTVIVHVILGLPGESREEILDTIRYLASLNHDGKHIDGIKLQLLHVLKGTDLNDFYLSGVFEVMELGEYLELVGDCLKLLPQDIVIHRVSGDGPKSILTAPLWSANKRMVLNSMAKYFKEHEVWQGKDVYN